MNICIHIQCIRKQACHALWPPPRRHQTAQSMDPHRAPPPCSLPSELGHVFYHFVTTALPKIRCIQLYVPHNLETAFLRKWLMRWGWPGDSPDCHCNRVTATEFSAVVLANSQDTAQDGGHNCVPPRAPCSASRITESLGTDPPQAPAVDWVS